MCVCVCMSAYYVLVMCVFGVVCVCDGSDGDAMPVLGNRKKKKEF